MLTENQINEIQAALAEQGGAVLEHVASGHNVSVADVARCLPEDQAVVASGDKFEEVMTEISNWGPVTFIVHTDDIVLECKDTVPPGSFARGYYNIHGDSAIGGHIKADNCESVIFVSRPFMGRESHSVQFYSKSGACMYKVYLGRDKNRELIPEQVEKFKKYRATL